MVASFEVKLYKPISIETEGNTKEVESIEIIKPVVKYRFKYLNFYQLLTKALLQEGKQNSRTDEYEDKEALKKELKKDVYDQEVSSAIGALCLNEQIVRELFKFLSLGDDENPVCKIFGSKISDLELDILKDHLDDLDIAAMVGGIINHFLLLTRL